MSAQVEAVSASAQALAEMAQALQHIVAQFALPASTAGEDSHLIIRPAAPTPLGTTHGNGRRYEDLPAAAHMHGNGARR
jgi:hypothetical protein